MNQHTVDLASEKESIETVVYVHYGKDDRKLGLYNLNFESKKSDIENHVSAELKKTSFHLEIEDFLGTFVNFDCESLRNICQQKYHYKGVKLHNSNRYTIDLYVRETGTSEIQLETQSSDLQLYQQTTTVSQLCPSTSFSVQRPIESESTSAKRCHLTFKINVNQLLHEDYLSNGKRTRTGIAMAKPVSIQGDKTNLPPKKQHTRVLPTIRVSGGGEELSKTTKLDLVCSFAREICVNGQRSLYHHPIYEFSNGGKNQSNKSSTTTEKYYLPWDEKFLSKEGHVIDVKLVAVVGAKTHPNKLMPFYELQNQYSNDTNYETNRLVILIEDNGRLLYDKMLLSKAVAFCHSKNDVDLAWYEARNNNGDVVEKIPMISKKNSTTAVQTETEQNSSNKRRKTSGDQGADSDIPVFYINESSMSMISTVEILQTNAWHDFNSTGISITNTTNILPATDLSTSEVNSIRTIYPPNDNNDHFIAYDQNQVALNSPRDTDLDSVLDDIESLRNDFITGNTNAGDYSIEGNASAQ